MLAIVFMFFLTVFPLYTHSYIEKVISNEPTTHLIVYSFDRPLQLYAFLESTYMHITGLEKITVIYRASNDEYAHAYTRVQHDFPETIYLKQGDNPRKDFKELTVRALNSAPSNYTLFAVDDIVVTRNIDLVESIKYLQETGAYGFYFRLGTQLTDCYSLHCKQAVPALEHVAPDVFKWQLCTGGCDWGYPNTVDMTLYKKSDIKHTLESMHYTSPNSLEGNWACNAHSINKRLGLCYLYSKIVNLPLNKVQNEINNRHMKEMSPQQLLDLFNQNLKLDIKPLFEILNPSAHMEYTPTFVARS